jgi:serine/threonine protein kinase
MSRRCIGEYDIIDVIGRGRFGMIYKAWNRTLSRNVAVKCILSKKTTDDERALAARLVTLSGHIESPYVIRTLDIFHHGPDLFLVTEYADLGDLDSIIRCMAEKRSKFTESDIWRVVFCVAAGLDYLHTKHRVIHRDIKPANIFVSQFDVKIGDLGLVCSMDDPSDTSSVGTPYYLSPDIIRGDAYSFQTDLWSFGCLIYEMAQLKVPFDGETLNNVRNNIQNGSYAPIDAVYSMRLIALIASLLQVDATLRPSTIDIVEMARQELER